jgi:cytochrome c peroxidase
VKKFSIIAGVVVLVAGGFATSRVLAMPDVTAIVANCGIAQSVLNQIEKADTGSRINRGHDYNELLDLMFAMNARLSANKIAAPALTNLASQFEQNLATFRTNYDNYSDALSNVIGVKCASKPLDFYSKLETARTARALLKQNVATLSQNIDNFYNQFNTIMKEAR